MNRYKRAEETSNGSKNWNKKIWRIWKEKTVQLSLWSFYICNYNIGWFINIKSFKFTCFFSSNTHIYPFFSIIKSKTQLILRYHIWSIFFLNGSILSCIGSYNSLKKDQKARWYGGLNFIYILFFFLNMLLRTMREFWYLKIFYLQQIKVTKKNQFDHENC